MDFFVNKLMAPLVIAEGLSCNEAVSKKNSKRLVLNVSYAFYFTDYFLF